LKLSGYFCGKTKVIGFKIEEKQRHCFNFVWPMSLGTLNL